MKRHNKIPRLIQRAYPNVKKIQDAKGSIKIHVMEKDCKKGEGLNPNECALAQAVKRQFKADAAIIGLSTSYIIKGGKATRFTTPVRIGREIVSFDRNKDFAEGTYTLIPKAKSQRLGTSHNSSSLLQFHME